jgi:hypothetical protein
LPCGFDVIEDGGTSFGEGGEAVVVNQLVGTDKVRAK